VVAGTITRTGDLGGLDLAAKADECCDLAGSRGIGDASRRTMWDVKG